MMLVIMYVIGADVIILRLLCLTKYLVANKTDCLSMCYIKIDFYFNKIN